MAATNATMAATRATMAATRATMAAAECRMHELEDRVAQETAGELPGEFVAVKSTAAEMDDLDRLACRAPYQRGPVPLATHMPVSEFSRGSSP
jgi:hypothetical protein